MIALYTGWVAVGERPSKIGEVSGSIPGLAYLLFLQCSRLIVLNGLSFALLKAKRQSPSRAASRLHDLDPRYLTLPRELCREPLS